MTISDTFENGTSISKVGNVFLAIGAAAADPDPPCSIITEIENLGFFEGMYPTKSA